jgi:hypothetical protein
MNIIKKNHAKNKIKIIQNNLLLIVGYNDKSRMPRIFLMALNRFDLFAAVRARFILTFVGHRNFA